MPAFTFVFGYASLEDMTANRHGHDQESCAAVRIVASSESGALDWGREIAEWYLKRLTADENYSWKRHGFASWIERNPDQGLIDTADEIGEVSAGDYPEYDVMRGTLGD